LDFFVRLRRSAVAPLDGGDGEEKTEPVPDFLIFDTT
jgi:hypothetical protein